MKGRLPVEQDNIPICQLTLDGLADLYTLGNRLCIPVSDLDPSSIGPDEVIDTRYVFTMWSLWLNSTRCQFPYHIDVELGNLDDPDDIDPSKFIISPNEKVYRILSREKDFESQAGVFFIRDYSGSMGGKPPDLAVTQHGVS